MFRPPPVTFTSTSGTRRTVSRICSICPTVSLVDAPDPRLPWLTTSRVAGPSGGTQNFRLLTAALPGDQGGFGNVMRLLFEAGEDDPSLSDILP